MYCYFLSLDMDGCHISDPHIPMRTLYACVYCVPGSPRYPHPLTRLCVWRLLPARLLVDPGLPGSTGLPGFAFHTTTWGASGTRDFGGAALLHCALSPKHIVLGVKKARANPRVKCNEASRPRPPAPRRRGRC